MVLLLALRFTIYTAWHIRCNRGIVTPVTAVVVDVAGPPGLKQITAACGRGRCSVQTSRRSTSLSVVIAAIATVTTLPQLLALALP